MEHYAIQGEFLSPVHIGTGQKIEPFDYIIKKPTFYRIDLSRFITETDDETRAYS